MHVAVIGAGSGGQSIAGYLASQGNKVNLYNRSLAKILPLLFDKKIELQGELNLKGRLNKVSEDISEVVDGVDLIMVATTANGHYDIAKELAPHLKDGQSVILNPGKTFGSVEFVNTLLDYGCEADVNVGETNTLIYATRNTGPGLNTIKGIKSIVSLSVIPTHRTAYVSLVINEYYPQFQPVESFLETSFDNPGPILHPVITLFNRDRIKRGEKFEFYREGATEEIVDYMQRVDNERARVARLFGVKTTPLGLWASKAYGLDEETLYDSLHNNPSYAEIWSPHTLNMRYLTEDVPTGLVPVSELGSVVGVKTPHIDELIELASEELRIDFRKEGRTLDKLGLDKNTIYDDLEHIIHAGQIIDLKKIKESL